MNKLLLIYLFVLFLILPGSLPAQHKDSLETGFVSKMEAFFRESAKNSKEEVETDRASIRQVQVMEEIKVMGGQSRSLLKNGLDSNQINTQLDRIISLHTIAKDGIFDNKGTAHSSRNLTVSYNILTALTVQLKKLKRDVDRFQSKQIAYRLGIDSLSSDPSLFIHSRDSVELMSYMNSLKVLAVEITPILKRLRLSIKKVQESQNKLNLELMKLESDMEEIQYLQSQISYHTLEREFVDLWQPSKFNRPLHEILFFSYTKQKLLYQYYLKAHWGKAAISVLGILFIIVFIYSLRAKNRKENKSGASLLFKSPVASGFVIGSGVMQFIFPAPPFVLTVSILIVGALLLCYILKGTITNYWMVIWSSIVLLFIVSGIDNLILQPSRPERWFMLFIGTAAVGIGLIALLNRAKQKEIKESWILYPIGLMVLLEICAVFLNIFGRFNLSKVMLIAGLTNVVVCILFLWILRLVNEGLQLASHVYEKQERKLFYINYNRVGHRAPLFFYGVLIVGWFILFGRNFYEFKFLSDPFKDFLFGERQLGNYHFSVYNLAVFFLIMLSAVIISKITSYFAAGSIWNSIDEQQNRFKLGSWILLIRISIIVIGTVLAFSALGIPLQQLSIIIGALGVGIGFGLQTLVNNLVSGLIIAVEKPVNVNDLIDIGGHSGRVKSIGFRSSIISTTNGADLIMPNGDLLNAHVLNWTLAGSKKRSTIHLEVKYGADLDKIKVILEDIIGQQESVLKSPEVQVLFANVTSSAVLIEAYFWLRSLDKEGSIKSNILENVSRRFVAEGIDFAVPRQEIVLNPKDDNN